VNGQSGKAGEDHVAQWLKERGYKIVARNFHSRFGEIDIIAQREPYIAFVEVKTRSQGSFVSPFEAITPAKQRKLVTTAKLFLQRHPTDLQPRFDAAAVYLQEGRIVGEEYIENVFC